MIEAEEKLSHYLIKAEEDPYSEAILQVAQIRMDMIVEQLKSANAINLQPTQLMHYVGQLFALQQIVLLPLQAKEHLDSLPNEEEVKGSA